MTGNAMRGFLAAAILLMAGNSGHAQFFSFNTGPGGEPVEIIIPRVCGDPSCVYVRVPGYFEIGRRYAPPLPPGYYGPPLGYEPPSSYEPPRGYRPPPSALPDYAEDGDETLIYAPPPAARRPLRQPRQIQTAPKKKLPKVAAVRDASPARTSVNRTTAPSQKPLLEAAPPQTGAAGALPPTATPAVAATPAPMAADNQPAAPAAPDAAAAPAVASTPEPTGPPKPTAEQEKSPLGPPPQFAMVPSPESERTTAAPPVAAATPKSAAAPGPPANSDPSPAAKSAKTVVAALPPAKQGVEERSTPAAAMPIGVWVSSEGQMRVERCGQNLCGYAVGGKNAGKMVLIHMRQTRDNHWSGQVNDVRSGQIYAGSMSMHGANALNIQGCALGGLFCGSRTMSRVQ